jgi:hypothetical protein
MTDDLLEVFIPFLVIDPDGADPEEDVEIDLDFIDQTKGWTPATDVTRG